MQVQVPMWIRVAVVVLLAGSVVWQPALDVYIDWLWFDALGHLSVYHTQLFTRLGLQVAGFVVGVTAAGTSLALARRRAPLNLWRLQLANAETPIQPERLQRLARWGVIGAAAVVGSLFAQSMGSSWLDLLSWAHRLEFGTTDPIFGLDVGFYVFELPLMQWLQRTSVLLVVLTAFVTTGWYLLAAATENPQRPQMSEAGRRHLLALGALLFVLVSVGWVLDRYDLLHHELPDTAVLGVGYADATARLPGYLFAALLSLVTAGALVWSMRTRGWRASMIIVAVYVGSRIAVTGLIPEMVQDWVVRPSELDKERPYLEYNIAGTRAAYALDRIDVRPFEAEDGLTMDVLKENPLTVQNIRVWDSRPLLTTYAQLQEIRTQYEFRDIDVDRYDVDGAPRQMMLAAREMNVDALPGGQTWVNRHLVYTHGYGFTMSPVNVVTPEGLPELVVQDIPPTTTIDLPIERPEIYYGEAVESYAIVRTGEKEFDYPMGDENVYTKYEGTGGVQLSSLGRILGLAAHFESLDLLLSSYVQPDSRAMFRRNIVERVHHIAPFLVLDRNPYLVVADGHLYWMLDAYTVTDRYPYSASSRLTSATGERVRFNYIRNSVKVVVDAYEGSVQFYVADDSDPMVKVYSDIFEGLFAPMAEMPQEIADHVRYPGDFFKVQAERYSSYHMKDPKVFYNQEDLWELPKELYGSKPVTMEPYYLIMKLPGESTAEFILLEPFVPTERDNMIAWMAARCDAEHYGRLIVYTFPKQKLIFGPSQLEARFDQTPEISEQLTLWSQAGSSVIRGNLLVVPIEDSLLYVEPVYLEASNSELPELKRIIVSYEKRIAMARTLEDALAEVFGTMPDNLPAEPTRPTAPAPTAGTRTQVELATAAREALARAEALQRAGDWAGYGEALVELRDTLAELESVIASPTPEAPAAP